MSTPKDQLRTQIHVLMRTLHEVSDHLPHGREIEADVTVPVIVSDGETAHADEVRMRVTRDSVVIPDEEEQVDRVMQAFLDRKKQET